MFTIAMDLKLPAADRKVLTSILRSTSVPAGLARRARVILALADGESYESIASAHGVTDAFVARDMIARGIFKSTTDLRRKLMHYIRQHNKTCRPIRWSYSNPKNRIRATIN